MAVQLLVLQFVTEFMKYKLKEIPISYLIYQADRALHHNINLSLQKAGIPLIIEQWAIMHELFNQNRLTQQELATITRKDKTTLTRLIDTMEKNGWVQRIADPTDRRKKLICYTPKAENHKSMIVDILKENNKRALKNVSASKIDEMRETLLSIFQNLGWGFDYTNTNCRLQINKEK